jgi:hypothetical protein
LGSAPATAFPVYRFSDAQDRTNTRQAQRGVAANRRGRRK